MKTALLSCLLLSAAGAGEPAEAYAKTVRVKSLLRDGRTSEGKPLDFPLQASEVHGLEVTIPAGLTTGWHRHAHSGFAYVLRGQLQVVRSDSSRQTYGPGQAFAEVVGTLHEGRALGSEDVALVAFFLTDSGKPVSTKP